MTAARISAKGRIRNTPRTPGSSAAPWLAAGAIVAAVAFFHLMPMEIVPRLYRTEVLDAAHYVGFALVAILVMYWTMRRAGANWPGSVHVAFTAPIFLISLALLAEFSQLFAQGRTPGFGDLARDFVGIAAGVLIAVALRTRMRRLTLMLLAGAASLLAAGLFHSGIELAGKFAARSQFPSIVTFDGENDHHLYRRMGARLEVVSEPAAWINSDNILRVSPRARSQYSGVGLENFRQDWSGFDALTFTASSAPGTETSITVRVYDADSIEDYFDQYNRVFELDGHPRSIQIPLPDIVNGPALRQLNIERIREVVIFTDGQTDFFVDNVRLQ